MLTTMRYLLLTALITLAANASAFATTKTWIGSPGGDWEKNGNWSPFGAPASGDDTIVSGAPTVSTSVTVNSILLNGTITIASGGTLTSTTTVVSSSTFLGSGTFVNAGSFTADSNVSFGSFLTLSDSSGTTWNIHASSGSAQMTFYSTSVLNGDFHIMDTSSTVNISTGSTGYVTTNGSYYTAYSLPCVAFVGSGAFAWAGSGGVTPGSCP